MTRTAFSSVTSAVIRGHDPKPFSNRRLAFPGLQVASAGRGFYNTVLQAGVSARSCASRTRRVGIEEDVA
jgi:hypothetical protein